MFVRERPLIVQCIAADHVDVATTFVKLLIEKCEFLYGSNNAIL
jgi:hypothetical protein